MLCGNSHRGALEAINASPLLTSFPTFYYTNSKGAVKLRLFSLALVCQPLRFCR